MLCIAFSTVLFRRVCTISDQKTTLLKVDAVVIMITELMSVVSEGVLIMRKVLDKKTRPSERQRVRAVLCLLATLLGIITCIFEIAFLVWMTDHPVVVECHLAAWQWLL